MIPLVMCRQDAPVLRHVSAPQGETKRLVASPILTLSTNMPPNKLIVRQNPKIHISHKYALMNTPLQNMP
jgi:hypothetical protein